MSAATAVPWAVAGRDCVEIGGPERDVSTDVPVLPRSTLNFGNVLPWGYTVVTAVAREINCLDRSYR
jgi:hypothetical protein